MSRSFALLALLVASAASAQTPDSTALPLRRVRLADGTVFVGTVADEAADPLVVVTTDGVTRTFQRARVEAVLPLIRGRFFRTDPVRTRLFGSPTARTLGRGQTRLSFLGAPNLAVGVTDRVDVSAAGYVILGDGAGILPVVGVKGTVYQQGNVAVALGVSAFVPIVGDDDLSGAFIVFPYGAVTIGDETRSVNIGLTGLVGSDGGNFDVANGAVLSLGGELQINNGVKLIADGLVPITDDISGAVVFPGVRLFGDRFAVDVFGFVGLFRETDTIGFGGPPDFEPRTRTVTRLRGFAPVGGSVSYTF